MISAEPPAIARLALLAATVEAELRDRILPFWLGLRDHARGGFAGAATSDGCAVPSAPKGAVLHARILWAFSAAYGRLQYPVLLEAAAAAYRFIVEQLIDPVAGGVYWTATADGGPAERSKHLYAQAFAIYGLVAFHRASGERDALDVAQQLWRVIEREASDEADLGYFESFSSDWRPTPNRLMGRKKAPKTFNTHFHLFEAYGALWEAWRDPALQRRLEQLTALLTGPMLDRRRNTFRQYFRADWQHLDDGLSHGHDIEASWLIPAVADRLAPEVAAAARTAVSGIACAVFDRAVGADGGVVSDGGTDPDKVWWVQAEALVGFLDAYERRREMRFLDAAVNVWQFIERSVIDRAGGEWRWRVVRADDIRPALLKADVWKCPYHNVRACLEVLDRVPRLMGQLPTPPAGDR